MNISRSTSLSIGYTTPKIKLNDTFLSVLSAFSYTDTLQVELCRSVPSCTAFPPLLSLIESIKIIAIAHHAQDKLKRALHHSWRDLVGNSSVNKTPSSVKRMNKSKIEWFDTPPPIKICETQPVNVKRVQFQPFPMNLHGEWKSTAARLLSPLRDPHVRS